MFIRYGQWILLFWLFILRIGYSAAKDIRVVCYYTNWSVYRPGSAKFSPQNINPYLCTHLIYAFGGFTKENTLKPFDKYQDIEKGGYAKFTGLKTYNKNLKTLLAIGGWNEGSSRFSPMVANPERRKELVKNAIKFLRQNHFDGLDLDWEYPTFRDGGKPRDRENYAKLVEELREEFERESEKTGRPRLLLTMAVPAGIEYINKGYDVETLTKYLDWMNILSYDYHSAFEPAVNHHAPLYSLEEASEYNYDTELNIDYTIKHYLEMGADPSKLVVGIPTYGRSYTLFNPDANEIGAPADGPGDMGEATRENGYLAYYEICENIKSNDWTVVQPNDKAMGPYAYKDNQWVGYDDENIARRKAEYVAENGLGGIMFWAIDNDDFRGNCHGRPYPIIEAAKEALLAASGITEDNLISPPSKPTKPKTRSRNKTKLTSHQAEQTEISKSETPKPSAGSIRRRNRLKNKSRPSSTTERSRRITKKENTSTYSSLKVVTPSYTTPAPPSTPDQGGGFKCEDEGFFPHPKDCKKYYWCLSGPGELGIIAHQFTCPAGLYFNKAADSCDYTQNVLCNKKLSKATTTTTTTTTPSSKSTTEVTRATPSSLFFTSRVPPKITAATSRTTFKQSTTTEATYDDEYEYDDEETGIRDEKDSEEDPKVIKELIDLIKKAGGIEELEKQLKIHETNPSTGSLGTTPSTLTKTLVERFFSKSNKNNPKTVSYNTINRNSRGPQNVGLNQNDVSSNEKSAKSRPTYTSIIRQRPTTEKIEKDEETGNESENEKTELESKSRKIVHPEYVNIRRPKVSADEESTKSNFNRNKILGEGSQEEEEGGSKEEKPLFVRNSTPQYINIRRSRPTTTEGSATSKYTEIRRGSSRSTTQPQQTTEDSSTTSSYKTVSRSTTNSDIVNIKDTKDSSTPKYVIVTRGSTVHLQPIPVEITTSLLNVDITTEPVATTIVPESASVSKNFNLGTTVLINQQNIPISTTEFSTNGVKQTLITNKRTTPILLEPRPFSFPTRGSTTSLRPISEVSTEKSKATRPTISRFRTGPRRKSTTQRTPATYITTSKPAPFTRPTKINRRKHPPLSHLSTRRLESQDITTKLTPRPIDVRSRFPSRKPFFKQTTPQMKETTTATPDQALESSNQQSLEDLRNEGETTELQDIAVALHELQQAPVPLKKTTISIIPSTKRIIPTAAPLRTKHRFSTIQPIILTTPQFFIPNRHQTFNKINPYKHIKGYEYYEDSTGILGSIPEHSKVLLHPNGVIECLDQGNFPHPISCKKFIYCAKMESTKVLGWEYTCPKGLSFDPIGGMCNWSADLGCNE